MKSREEIIDEIKGILRDSRLDKVATLDENAPLALTQVFLKGSLSGLLWVIGYNGSLDIKTLRDKFLGAS